MLNNFRWWLIRRLLPCSSHANTPTNRGFARVEFRDRDGEPASLQKSSVATENLIWLGVNEPRVKRFYPHTSKPWRELDLSGAEHVGNQRLHLSQDNVAELLPYLVEFVRTGEL